MPLASPAVTSTESATPRRGSVVVIALALPKQNRWQLELKRKDGKGATRLFHVIWVGFGFDCSAIDGYV